MSPTEPPTDFPGFRNALEKLVFRDQRGPSDIASYTRWWCCGSVGVAAGSRRVGPSVLDGGDIAWPSGLFWDFRPIRQRCMHPLLLSKLRYFVAGKRFRPSHTCGAHGTVMCNARVRS